MKVALVYLHVVGLNSDYDPKTEEISGSFEFCAERFWRTYREFPAEYPHEILVVCAKGSPPNLRIYEGLKVKFLFYDGEGFCSGAHQLASFHTDADFALYSSARTHFWRDGWMRRLVEARIKHGDGMYGTMTSFESSKHIRTNFYGFNPAYFREMNHPLNSRPDTWQIEHGRFNMSHDFRERGLPSLLVTWDGEYPIEHWRTPKGIFRKGDQSNCVVWDRHTDIYARSSPEEKVRLTRLSDGENNS